MIQIFNYENSPIQFEVIDGQVMANATLMAKVFGKKPDDILKTKTWIEYENAVKDDTGLRFEDIRTVKNGDAGGSWIHQELVLEFSRRLNIKFSIWCNRIIAELLKNGSVSIKPKTAAEQLLDTAIVMVEHESRLSHLESTVSLLVQKHERAAEQINYLPLSCDPVPDESERTKVLRLVDNYCGQSGISHHETWKKLYEDLSYKYRVRLRSCKRLPGEKTYLDIAERLGHCGKLRTLISGMINDLRKIAS